MPDETPAGDTFREQPESQATAPPAPEGLTPGGYAYTVVDEHAAPVEKPVRVPREPRRLTLRASLLAALIIAPALVAAAAVWALMAFVFDSGGEDAGRVGADVTNVINAFNQDQPGVSVRQFEGEKPPGYPGDIPEYPGAQVVSSLVQVNGDDALYLVVYDTVDNREDVATELSSRFESDPWQVDAGRDSRLETYRQFSKIDDPDVSGVVLITGSDGSSMTTIVLSVEVVSGARAAGDEEFVPPVSGTLPEGFPDVPQYPDSILIDAAFNRAPRADSYLVSLITRANVDDVIGYYRDELQRRGWTVTDGDASSSELASAQEIVFAGDADGIDGSVIAGDFSKDRNYSQVDIQVTKSQ